MLLLGGAAAALLLLLEAENINRSGGWGWLLAAGIYVVAITIVCFTCALSTAISLFRREPHRRLSIAILILSCLVVSAFGPNLIRTVNRLRRQHDQATRTSEGTLRLPADSLPPATIRPTADKSSSAPVIQNVENPQILIYETCIRITRSSAGGFDAQRPGIGRHSL
jgi:hypothetical protein